MSDDTFKNIPESEITRRGWREYFANLAARARHTTWGLQDEPRRILGLCVMLDEALEREEKRAQFADELAEQLDDAHRKIKGLQLENGRLKKKAGAPE